MQGFFIKYDPTQGGWRFYEKPVGLVLAADEQLD
jgi:hypothetical protein